MRRDAYIKIYTQINVHIRRPAEDIFRQVNAWAAASLASHSLCRERENVIIRQQPIGGKDD